MVGAARLHLSRKGWWDRRAGDDHSAVAQLWHDAVLTEEHGFGPLRVQDHDDRGIEGADDDVELLSCPPSDRNRAIGSGAMSKPKQVCLARKMLEAIP